MKSGPRILFFGFSDVGYRSLELLLGRGCNVVGVFTHDTDPHESKWFEAPETLAADAGIPVFKPKSLRSPEWAETVRALSPDLILSLYYRSFIPPAIFSQARLGAYNMHGSYLPRYRGRAPLNWSIINGESYCGATLHVMEEGFDTGDIVDREKVEIGPDEYVGDIAPRVTKAAVAVLSRSLDSLLAGNPALERQDESLATYFGKRTPEDGRLDFSKTAREAYNLVRGVSRPFPGAFFDFGNRRFTVWRAEVGGPSEGAAPGSVVSENPLKIACSDRFLVSSDFDMSEI